MSTPERSRRARLERAGVPAVGGCEFRGVARTKPRVDTRGRVLVDGTVQMRAADGDDGPIIEGLGTVYNTPTVIGRYYPFRETFAAGAFSKTIADGADVRSMRNHDPNLLLGRTAADTLELWETDAGLHYRTQVNANDPTAMSTHAQVKRGDIDGSSIWFSVVRETWTFADDDNGLDMDEVVVEEAKLFETGPVVFPAYETTTSEARQADGLIRLAGMPDQTHRDLVVEALNDPEQLLAVLEQAGVDLALLRSRLAAPDHDIEGRAAEEAPAAGTPPRTRHVQEMQTRHEQLTRLLT